MPDTKVTKTVGGIEVTVDVRAFSDMRFIRLMTGLYRLDREYDRAEEEGDTARSGEISVEMMDRLDEAAAFIFGEDLDAVQAEVSAKNDGYLSFWDWLTFISRVIEAYQKNAGARPADGGKR